MKTDIKLTSLPPIIPIDDETRAMLDYASSPEGRAKIEKGRQEIREGKGIVGSASYFRRRIARDLRATRHAAPDRYLEARLRYALAWAPEP